MSELTLVDHIELLVPGGGPSSSGCTRLQRTD